MNIRQSIIFLAMAGMASICSMQADAEEMTGTQMQKTMTEEEQKKEEAKEMFEYL